MSNKKAICLATMASNLDNFNRNNVKILQELGYDVTLASNFRTTEDTNSQEKIDLFSNEMKQEGVHIEQVDFTRKIGNIKGHVRSYKQVKELFKQHFDIIHCHSPICAAITRLCAKKYRKEGTKVYYTAHGFHFYDGAPIKNWIMYYPAEKWLSKYTDVLITINKEDCKRARAKFKAAKTVYVPGVGVDTNRFGSFARRKEIRMELGIADSDKLLLSVGELNSNKNHEVVIRALSRMNELGELPSNVYYFIAGIGDKEKDLNKLIKEKKMEDRIKLIGYRSNISDYYASADVFVFPSFREGLSMSLMEAMACGLPVACSKIRGNTDLIDEMGGVFLNPGNIDSVSDALMEVLVLDKEKAGNHNREKIKGFDVEVVKKIMYDLYSDTPTCKYTNV